MGEETDDKRSDAPGEPAFAAGGEELLYARVLAWGARIGVCAVLLTLILYLSGAVQPLVPLEDMPTYWSLSIDDYQEKSGMRKKWAGVKNWQWVRHADRAEFLMYVGMALLAAVTIVCYASILPVLIRKGRRAHSVMVIIELLVLVLAASGVLSGLGV